MLFTSRCVCTAGGVTSTRDFAKDPGVIKFGGKYFLYYSALSSRDLETFVIGIAGIRDMENRTVEEPVPPDGGETWYLSRCEIAFKCGKPYIVEYTLK